jgi:hypothetical protein
MQDAHDALLDAVVAWLADAAHVDRVVRERAGGTVLAEGTADVLALARHGSPFRPLLALVEDRNLGVATDGARLTSLRGLPEGTLRREWEATRRRGHELLVERTRLGTRAPRPSQPSMVTTLKVTASRPPPASDLLGHSPVVNQVSETRRSHASLPHATAPNMPVPIARSDADTTADEMDGSLPVRAALHTALYTDDGKRRIVPHGGIYRQTDRAALAETPCRWCGLLACDHAVDAQVTCRVYDRIASRHHPAFLAYKTAREAHSAPRGAHKACLEWIASEEARYFAALRALDAVGVSLAAQKWSVSLSWKMADGTIVVARWRDSQPVVTLPCGPGLRPLVPSEPVADTGVARAGRLEAALAAIAKLRALRTLYAEGEEAGLSAVLAVAPDTWWRHALPAFRPTAAILSAAADRLSEVCRSMRASQGPAPSVEPQSRTISPRTPNRFPGSSSRRRTATSSRVTNSAASVTQRVARMENALKRWFGEHEPKGTPEVNSGRTLAWLEVAPGHVGALALWCVLAPIGDLLPPMVRTVTARHREMVHTLRRENLAWHGARFAVTPTDVALTWSTGAFDEDLSVELARLAIEPLPRERATAFRVDVEGVGQRLRGTVLAPGARYRLVVPGGDVWTLREVDVPPDVPDSLRDELASLGLTLGPAAIAARWMGAPPTEWRINARGGRYPCFVAGDIPLVEIDAGRDVGDGGLVVFVVGSGVSHHTPLPAGRRFSVALEDLAPGRYAFDCVPDDRAVDSTRLVFEVLAEAPPGQSPEFLVRCGELSATPDAEITIDLADFLAGGGSLEVAAPAAMSVDLHWEGASSWKLRGCTAELDGRVDLSSALPRLDESLTRDRVGMLAVDFGEWGVARVLHEARWNEPRAAMLRAAWRELLHDGLDLRSSVVLHPTLLRSAWVERVARALGYALADVPSDAPRIDGGGAWLLREHTRVGSRVKVRREVPLIVAEHVERASWGGCTLRRAVEELADSLGATEVIVTDVARWWRVDPTRARLGPGDALAEVLDDAERFEDFACVHFGGWR